jgi:hypothetical protein
LGIQLKGASTQKLGELTIVNVKKDLGANFANVATDLATYGVDYTVPVLAIMENTNAVGAGVRFYVKGDTTTGFKQIELGDNDRSVKVKIIPLTAVDTAGGVFAFSPGVAAIVTRVIVNVTTKTTGACTLDVGIAANGTTLNDTLIDGLDINTAVGEFCNLKNAGTNGLASQRMTSTQYVTGSVASGASAGLVGYAYIEYIAI